MRCQNGHRPISVRTKKCTFSEQRRERDNVRAQTLRRRQGVLVRCQRDHVCQLVRRHASHDWVFLQHHRRRFHAPTAYAQRPAPCPHSSRTGMVTMPESIISYLHDHPSDHRDTPRTPPGHHGDTRRDTRRDTGGQPQNTGQEEHLS